MNGQGPEFRNGNDLVFVPLGGAGEIGMNLSLYGHRGRWLMVDLGIGFDSEATPGVDIVVPDVSFITRQRDMIDGLVLTHAHEDHLGAVPYLWSALRCPIYATPFACAVLRRKLTDAGLIDKVPLHEVPSGGRIDVGPFGVQYIHAAHSIPEGHILAIRTSAGVIAHVSDWKLDPGPLVGAVTDEAALRQLGDEGVLVMTCDSTNVFVPGQSGSEAALRQSLTELVGRYDRRVAIACFASNVARVESIVHAAAANDRNTCLVGRSLLRIVAAARETGYLQDVPPLLGEHDVGYLPPERALLAVTGSQGEPRSALARIAAGDHPSVTLEAGDVVIFSSRVIPGNEVEIARVQNQLARLGIKVVTERDHFVHVSGHPARDELVKMYQWLQPKTLIPIHGEARHLLEHVELARACGVPNTLVAENGSVVRLAPDTPAIIDHITSGKLAVDGSRLLPIDSGVLRQRQRIRFGGAAVATIVLDRKGHLVAEPQLTVPGLLDGADDAEIQAEAVEAIIDAIEGLPLGARGKDSRVSEVARAAVRRVLRDAVGKRPVTEIHLVRV